ncbi:hypothetical protein NA57DRAFT_70910 [Rhizodiscina lignyota]|uniref:Cytoplasmic tRNA 2-thiolation protein 2 n=1 Tax=Rhizodiscina lignyota TaxID=1504668 RepID=A0A9P4IUJ3_9PEZI|nr:hypothetical protein NA57DRAFT_70910 [Rhizodiscina lignyota]
MTLLHVLDFQLQSQARRTGRTGFTLHVLHIELPHDGDRKMVVKLYEDIKARYPGHSYSSIRLFDDLNQPSNGTTTKMSNGPDIQEEATSNGGHKSYAKLLSSLPSVTSRTDVLHILRMRRTVDFACSNNCEGILWGDSTTRLAEKVLAETAKGRGFSLPWQIADGDSPFGVPFYYPMRDLLKKELVSYTSMITPPVDVLVALDSTTNVAAPVASKDGSIDFLMKQYFESVEEQYPSIVANVVRTTGKLEMKDFSSGRQCALCNMLLANNPTFVNGNSGHDSVTDGPTLELCYGCATAVPPESRHLIPPGLK